MQDNADISKNHRQAMPLNEAVLLLRAQLKASKRGASMVVLWMAPGQGIIIADNILISIDRVEGSIVKFGIAAPLEVVVVRDELLRPRDGKESEEHHE